MNKHEQPDCKYLSVYRVYIDKIKNLNLYGGQYPGATEEKEHNLKVNELMNLKVDSIICLMKDSEMRHFLSYRDTLEKLNYKIDFTSFPIIDMSIPDKDHMKKILDKINILINENKNIYIHCWGGNGRTGTVVGCLLKSHGVSNKEIISLIKEWRRETLFDDTPAPETDEQINFVYNWPIN